MMLFAVVLHSAFAAVVINEIHYAPDPKTDPVEFVELYNPGPNSTDLSGWQVTGGIAYSIPNGTSLNANQYLVLAQDPAAILARFSVSALGPWTGRLGNSGDKITLHNASGGIEDEVDYQLGFPWPTVGDPPGYSIELVNPNSDNNLGGNWRASVVATPLQQTKVLFADHSVWSCFKGLTEASTPTTAWRLAEFDDTGWLPANAPVGYDADLPMGTPLTDMSGRYTSFFLRKVFVLEDPTAITSLRLEALYDDGFKLWINGTNVWNQSLPAAEVPYNGTATGTARESNYYDTFNLDNPSAYLRRGTNIVAVQVHNILLSGSSDCFFDARLTAVIGPPGHGPTPGALNSVFATNVPPQIRQVDHSPSLPASGQPVTITAKITDPQGVAAVRLLYQVVDPGNYISLTNVTYATNWISLAMNDAGLEGDVQAGDSIFTAVLPAALQQHRRLVRYRITATDGAGSPLTVPYPDDPQPNFAYFCYDGVPAWQGALKPGTSPIVTFDTNVVRRLPAVHLIAQRGDVEAGTWFSRYEGDAYPWLGTLVYDGKVYDHIHFRARGGVWRYAMVKNMWKFDLNRGHDLEMRDNYDRKFKTHWTKLNLGACIQQGDFGHRGEQGMFESVGFRLFNLAGVEAPKTVFAQLRVIDDAVEAPADQYEGDFWGLYLVVEQEDGRFLDEHNQPDGNFYKMEGGTGTLNNQGFGEPTDKSDLNAFLSGYQATNPVATEEWWRLNLDLSNYWSYQAIVQGIHHYDICYDKNYFYLHNPLTGLWSVHSWDLDLTWADNMFDSGCGGIDDLYAPVFGNNTYPEKVAMTMDYRNRVREIRDLLFNTDQAWQLIDEQARLLRGSTNGPTFLDADRAMWDWNPKMANSAYTWILSKAGQGRFYAWPYEPTVSKDFAGCIQLMKNYVVTRSSVLDALASDPYIPSQPSLAYVGPAGYPLNRLTFRCSSYAGSSPFAAMRWRVAEVSDPNAPTYDPTEPGHYEITAAWESERIPWTWNLTLPASPLQAGHAYRTRVRLQDNTGRWSHWSAPIQFVAGPPDTAAALVSALRITELMYAPPAGSDYEFVELHNTSDSLTLDLQGAKFTSGVDFTFPIGTTMAPGSYLLVVGTTNLTEFRSRYGLATSVPIVGPYSGNLANEGEQITLKVSSGGDTICSFQYNNSRLWPVGPRGADHSLVPLDSALQDQATGALDYPGNWRASTRLGGSPGQADPPSPPPTVVLNEIMAHTDYTDPLRPEYDSNDWLELLNTTATDISLDHWFLSDDPANPRKWAIPQRSLPARGRLTLDEVHDFHTPITTGFGLNKAGEQLLLSYLPGTAEDRVVDAVEFRGQENGVSLGRYPDGNAWWSAMRPSSNSVNTARLPGLVISEVMYHPVDLVISNNTRDEFIELVNPTTSPVTLESADGRWRLSGGVGFEFPSATTIPPGGALLVVNFDPTNTLALEVFQAAYGLTNLTVPVLGPWSGNLDNRSDRVTLEKPQFPDLPGDPYSWVIVDEVVYGNQNPWPTNANGGGSTLQRLSFARSGNDPANWFAAAPSPGLTSTVPLDSDGDGMPDAWELLYHLDPLDPADAELDADGDGMSNLAELLSGTDPRDSSSALGFGPVTVTNSLVVLRFIAQAGKSYTIQYKTEAAGTLWEKLATVPPDELRVVEVSDPATRDFAARFYRLVTPALP